MANFVNFSNHPSSTWSLEQTAAALEILKKRGGGKDGKIVDLQFPTVDPHTDNDALHALAAEYIDKVAALDPAAIMVQGEMNFTWAFIKQLYAITGIPCYAACSERQVIESVNRYNRKKKPVLFRTVPAV